MCAAQASAAPPAFRMRIIEQPHPEQRSCRVLSVNSSGAMILDCWGVPSVYDGKKITPLAELIGVQPDTDRWLKLNDRGEIVGSAYRNPEDDWSSPFFYSRERGLIWLGSHVGTATSINSKSQVVGAYYETGDPNDTGKGFIWSPEGGFVPIPSLDSSDPVPASINDSGTWVGLDYGLSYGFLVALIGQAAGLGYGALNDPSGVLVAATFINNRGDIAGHCRDSMSGPLYACARIGGGFHAYYEKWSLRPSASWVTGLSSRGALVGEYRLNFGAGGTFYAQGDTYYDSRSLLFNYRDFPEQSDLVVESVDTVSESGLIAGGLSWRLPGAELHHGLYVAEPAE
jgi:hypothetical protein